MNSPAKTRQRGTVELDPPWNPPLTEAGEHAAIRALYEGKADERQQALFLAWFIRCTAVGHMSYRPGAEGDRDTAFAEGKRHVGRMFFDLAKTALSTPTSRT